MRSVTAVVVALLFAVLAFGISTLTNVACGGDACFEDLLGPIVMVVAIDLVLATTFVPTIRSKSGPLFTVIAVVLAVVSVFAAVLWAGQFASSFFGDRTNPWRSTQLAFPARALVYVRDLTPVGDAVARTRSRPRRIATIRPGASAVSGRPPWRTIARQRR
jgi:hypothetical protein